LNRVFNDNAKIYKMLELTSGDINQIEKDLYIERYQDWINILQNQTIFE